MREQLAGPGYAVLHGAVDAGELRRLRACIVAAMDAHGWVLPGEGPLPSALAPREGGDGWWPGYTAIQGIEELHSLGHGKNLIQAAGEALGSPVLSHNRRVASLTLPGYGTPPHQDFVSVQGSADTLAAWIPLDDRDGESAAIRFLPAGGEPRLLPLEWVDGISAQVRADPADPAWDQPRVQVGDAVIFHGLTVHELRPNLDDRYRIACEMRFQPLTDPVCRASLMPHHFPRVPGWGVLARAWRSASWVDVPDGVTLAPFVMPRRIEQWHAGLTVPPSRLPAGTAGRGGSPGDHHRGRPG
ncbi:MAG: phytanoyl-CoA dioxygenase family protein [Streptosporangiaceae bacterium]